MLERTKIAEDLLTSMGYVLRRVKGSLAIGVVIVGALLAASTGIVGATVVTIGVLSLGTMLKNGYQKELSCGVIAASGTLGQIVPPSIVLVILGDMMNVDVGDLFAGAIIPGLTLVSLYLVYVWGRIALTPNLAPEPDLNEDSANLRWHHIIKAMIPPALLVSVVLGTILSGMASPTEAAACGAFGAILIALAKRKLSIKVIRDVSQKTAETTAMVFFILVGAQFFGVVFRGLMGDEIISDIMLNLDVSKNLILVCLMLMLFVLGFFLDFLEICFIIVPIIMPIMTPLGFDPLWLAIVIAVNLQTSFLTPPFGFSLFYLKGVAPKEVSTGDIYRGVLPFVCIQITMIFILWAFPEMVLWLPKKIF